MTTMYRSRVLPLALCLAAGTTYVTYRFLTEARTGRSVVVGQRQPAPRVTVVVPVAEVAPLRPLQTSMFETRRLPAGSMPRDVVADPAELEGKVSLSALRAGQPVPRAEVVARGPHLGLAFTVRPPRRAVTVALDPVIGVAGFPKPGNHVDVLASFTTTAGMLTRTVLENVEILALGGEVQPVRQKPASSGTPAERPTPQPTATLAVLPAEAERLILAESRGKLRLALRGVDDTARAKPAGVGEFQLTGVPAVPGAAAGGREERTRASRSTNRTRPVAEAPRRPAAGAPHRVLVVRGSQHEVIQVARPQSPAPAGKPGTPGAVAAEAPAAGDDRPATAAGAVAAEPAPVEMSTTDPQPSRAVAAQPSGEGDLP